MPRCPLVKERLPLVAGVDNLQFLTLFEDCLSLKKLPHPRSSDWSVQEHKSPALWPKLVTTLVAHCSPSWPWVAVKLSRGLRDSLTSPSAQSCLASFLPQVLVWRAPSDKWPSEFDRLIPSLSLLVRNLTCHTCQNRMTCFLKNMGPLLEMSKNGTIIFKCYRKGALSGCCLYIILSSKFC